MSRITDYPAANASNGMPSVSDSDIVVVDGASGTRKITLKELSQALADKLPFNAYSVGVGYGKSGIYRGANLGSGTTFSAASTAEQRASIANGTFKGLFIGDYWTVNNVVYRIADFNYWKRSGDTDFNTNHIVLVNDNSFGDGPMNDTNITTGAYLGSKMYTDSSSVLNTAKTKIATDFGSFLATHRLYLPNTVDSTGAQSAGTWVDSTAELMNEPMVYGCFHHAKPTSSVGHLYTCDKAQLALFRLNPAMVNLRYYYWLRDVVSSAYFAFVGNGGAASCDGASTSLGVRVAFPVKGA